jgi:hypothetical protein
VQTDHNDGFTILALHLESSLPRCVEFFGVVLIARFALYLLSLTREWEMSLLPLLTRPTPGIATDNRTPRQKMFVH